MNRSYIGIVTACGLQAIYRENEHVIRFLNRRLYRREPYRGLCYWAVISDEMADWIERHVELGEHQLALQIMQRHAIDGGSILPSFEKCEF